MENAVVNGATTDVFTKNTVVFQANTVIFGETTVLFGKNLVLFGRKNRRLFGLAFVVRYSGILGKYRSIGDK